MKKITWYGWKKTEPVGRSFIPLLSHHLVEDLVHLQYDVYIYIYNCNYNCTGSPKSPLGTMGQSWEITRLHFFWKEQTLRIQDSTIPTRRMTVASWTSSKVQPPEFGPPKAWKASSWVARNVPFYYAPVAVFILYVVWHTCQPDLRYLRTFWYTKSEGYFPESRSHRWRNLWGNSSRCLLSEPSSVRESPGFRDRLQADAWMAQVFCGACQVCHFEALIFSCRLYSFCSSAFRWLSEIFRKGLSHT